MDQTESNASLSTQEEWPLSPGRTNILLVAAQGDNAAHHHDDNGHRSVSLLRTPRPLLQLTGKSRSELLGLIGQRRRWISFDTETTGFKKTDHIVELAGVEWINGVRTGAAFAARCRLEVPIHPMAAAVNGVVAADYASYPPLSRVLLDWEQFVAAGDTPCLLIAHNAPFDLRFLQQAAPASTPLRSITDNDVICTRQLFKAVFGIRSLPKFCLDSCLTHCAIPSRPDGERHSALRDAELAGELFAVLFATLVDDEAVDDVSDFPTASSNGRPVGTSR